MAIEYIAWALQQDLPTGPKFVLVALSNRANENGECWPSQKDLSSQTGMSPRGVRRHLIWLLSKGIIKKFVRRRANGSFTSDSFSIQRPNCPAAKLSSGTDGHPLPIQNNQKVIEKQHQRPKQPAAKLAIPETSLSKKEETSIIPPDGVSSEVWNDFVKHRKAKKAPISKTAIDGINREALKAGWVLEDALREICSRGWQGFKAEWVKEQSKGKQNAKINGHSNGKSTAVRQAIAEALIETHGPGIFESDGSHDFRNDRLLS